jgi:hypothetical protein
MVKRLTLQQQLSAVSIALHNALQQIEIYQTDRSAEQVRTLGKALAFAGSAASACSADISKSSATRGTNGKSRTS